MVVVSDLSQELIVSVAQRLHLLEDFLDFGAVCRSWRSAATRENFAGAGVPLLMIPRVIDTTPVISFKEAIMSLKEMRQPEIMLPKKILKAKKKQQLLIDQVITDMVDLYSLARGKILRLNLPEIKRKVCFSSLGWLLTHSEKDFKFSLLHPISRSTIGLPDGWPSFRYRKIRKFVLSSSPSSSNPDYTVVLQALNDVFFCRPGLGDKSWTRMHANHAIRELYCFRGQFYVVQVEILDAFGLITGASISVISDDFKDLREVAPTIPAQLHTPFVKDYYLVESGGRLLLVLFVGRRGQTLGVGGCRVFELPRNGNSWLDSEVSLGNTALFLGSSNSSFSIEASDHHPGCKPNCIYFINDTAVFPEVDPDIGIFNLADGTIDRQPFASFASTTTGFEYAKKCPLWIQPTAC